MQTARGARCGTSAQKPQSTTRTAVAGCRKQSSARGRHVGVAPRDSAPLPTPPAASAATVPPPDVVVAVGSRGAAAGGGGGGAQHREDYMGEGAVRRLVDDIRREHQVKGAAQAVGRVHEAGGRTPCKVLKSTPRRDSAPVELAVAADSKHRIVIVAEHKV